jgi:outer membrane immunogenic protein
MHQDLRAALVPMTILGFCGIASAADMPVKVKAPPPAPVYYNWTGFYLGVNLGGAWARQSGTLFVGSDPVAIIDRRMNGVIGGGQIGYNWQFAPWFGWGNGTVLGLEADIDGSSQKSDWNFSVIDPIAGPASGSGTDRIQWFGTVRGRAGIAFDRWLPYVTGGWAYGHRNIEGAVTVGGVATSFDASKTNTNGWTVGGGVEWAFWDHWTAKLEYLHLEFNNDNNVFVVTPVVAAPVTVTTGHLRDDLVRAGVNYKF